MKGNNYIATINRAMNNNDRHISNTTTNTNINISNNHKGYDTNDHLCNQANSIA